MKKIFYWCPFIDKVATVKAVVNSCIGLRKYTKNNQPYIIDAAGEFEDISDKMNKENIITIPIHIHHNTYNVKCFYLDKCL